MPQRDDFSEPIKRAIAARVGNLCSNPDCRARTSGPHEDAAKSINLGVAAHITAAAPGGPRYDVTLTSAQRSSAENAIWLCQNCGKLIDSDPVRFHIALLREWKDKAEEEARSRVGRTATSPPGPLSRPPGLRPASVAENGQEGNAIDVLVVTVIPPELHAVVAALGLGDAQRVKDTAGTIYYRGTLRSALSGLPLRIGVTCVGGAGNPDAAATVRDAVAWGHPRAAVLVGIAAGVPGKVQIGEVVLSERVVSYEPAALVGTPAGAHVERRPEMERLSHAMSQHVTNYRPEPARLINLFTRVGERIADQPAAAQTPPASTITVHIATIASGEKLLRDAHALQEIRQLHGKTLAIDMESAGMVAACRRDNIPWLVIRGISDFGDSRKDDRYHHLAARAAAAVLADFLVHGLDLPPYNLDGARRTPSGHRPRLYPPLSPRYPDERTRTLSEQLQDALGRRRALTEAGAKTADVDQEVVQLKRQLREGGQLRAGDAVGEGRYLLIEPLGRGGFASVWKALDRVQNAAVAVKVLHANLANDPIARDRFFRGARIMAELDHPAITRVVDTGAEDGGFCYFAMEIVPNGNLRSAVLAGRLPRDRALPLLLRIGEALAYAHGKGIIHRDVKPANILLDENGDPKLTDFDLVAAGDTTGGTRTGVLGTVIYAAPECLHHPHEADARADVYGLGMTIMFCLHGSELPMDVIRGADAIVDTLDCAEPVRHLLEQAIAWNRTLRPADAGALCKALREALRTGAVAETVTPTPTVDILYWLRDGHRYKTVWLTEDGPDLRVVAHIPALVFAAGDQIWVAKYVKRKIQLLAPEALSIRLSRVEMEDYREDDLPTIDAELDDMLLISAISGRTISLSTPIISVDEGEHPSAFELEASISILCSVGHYLLTYTGVREFSGGAHGFYHAIFRTIDLRSGDDVDLLTDEERMRLTNTEGRVAEKRLREIVDDFWESDQRPELTLFLLSYHGYDGEKLHAEYQFTCPIHYAGSDGRWSSYSRSERILSETLPAALEPYREAPSMLRSYWEKAGRVGTKPCWTAVNRTRSTRTMLRRLVEDIVDRQELPESSGPRSD